MSTPTVEVAIKNCCPTIGEGPHWDVVSQSLYFVDIHSGGVHRWDSNTKQETKINLDGSIGFVIPRTKGGVAVGLGRTVSSLNFDTKAVEQIAEVEQGTRNRFNDAKCDSHGRIWAGTMGYEETPGVVPKGQGKLYTVGTDLKCVQHLDNIDISNGMDWTDDSKVMYYIDSVPRKVYAFDFDLANGTIANQRVAVDFDKEEVEGLPDGMCIDVDGNIWVACFSASQVVQFNPSTGKALQTVKFPATNITSCCFGGKDLDELYVTSSCWKLPENNNNQPLAGSMFRVTGLGTKGRAPNDFKG